MGLGYAGSSAIAGDVAVFGSDGGLLMPVEVGSPANPALGVRLSVVRLAERSWLQWRRPQGPPTFVSPHLAFNRVGVWVPGGTSANTPPGIFGMPAMQTIGTGTGRSFSTVNAHLRRKRIGYVSVATAAGNMSFRTAPNVSLGTGTVGGFLSITRFSTSDAATVSGARTFVGMSTSNAAPAGAVAEPSTQINQIGMGHGAADTNMFIYFGGSTAQTPINLGVNFPANTLSADMYELILHGPTESTVCHWTVNRYGTATNAVIFTASGTLANATPGTTLPTATSGLCTVYAWRTNNATALAVALDIHSHYFETDGG